MVRARVRVDKAGRILIPAAQRKALGLHPGDDVVIVVEDGEARILSRLASIRRAQALIRPYLPKDRSLADELIAERRAEAARE